MKTSFSVTSFLLAISLVKALEDFPAEVLKCPSSNNDACIAKSIKKLLELFPQGNSNIGLTDVSAVKLPETVFAENKNNSPMQLNFKFTTLTIRGMEKLQPLLVHGFNKNLTNTVDMEVLIPKITLEGDYEMTGKLLLLPLDGKGKGKIDLIDSVLKIKTTFMLTNRNNKNYAAIKKNKLWAFEPKRVIFDLQNLLKNNAVLSDSIKEVINENWRDLWQELKTNAIKVGENLVKNIVNEVFNVLSVDDMYTD